MHVVLTNKFHAGDVIMTREIIRRVWPILRDTVRVELDCAPRYRYLWMDLGIPFWDETGEPHAINLWFGHVDGVMGRHGLTHETQVESWNIQARPLGLPEIAHIDAPPIDLPIVENRDRPGILVENGPVLSGQPVQDINGWLKAIAMQFHAMPFYLSGRLDDPHWMPNMVDRSDHNLLSLSALSGNCIAMISRLSSVTVASFTAKNRGRLPRIVAGHPLGCPIWDERDITYAPSITAMIDRLREVVR